MSKMTFEAWRDGYLEIEGTSQFDRIMDQIDIASKTNRVDRLQATENALHDAMKAAIETGEPQWIGNYIYLEKGSVRCYVVAEDES